MYGDAKQLSEITLLAFLTYRNSSSAVSETRQSSELEGEYLFFVSKIIQGVARVRRDAFFQSFIYKM